MAPLTLQIALRNAFASARPQAKNLRYFAPRSQQRSLHRLTRANAITSSITRHRPTVPPSHEAIPLGPAALPTLSRTIFIQTQSTPNADASSHSLPDRHANKLQALKFVPNHPVLPDNFPSTFLEYTSPRSTLAPPHPSPLAAKLLSVDGISSIFYGPDFITVTKVADVNWAHIKPEVFSLITEAVTSGEQIVNTVDKTGSEDGQEVGGEDTLTVTDEDSEVVAMIKELLETRIRPAIQEDGGDLEFRGFEDGMVLLKLRGACRTCDSSTVTLKNGIESMLMHYVRKMATLNWNLI